MSRIRWIIGITAIVVVPSVVRAQALPGTKLLEGKDDFARVMVNGIGKWLDRETAAAVEKRREFWKPDYSSPEAYVTSVTPNRERLKRILGVVDERLPVTMQYTGTTSQPALIAETETFKVYTVRWPVLPGVD